MNEIKDDGNGETAGDIVLIRKGWGETRQEGVVETYGDVTKSAIARSWDAADRSDTNGSGGGVFEGKVCVR